ncbi:calcineurin-like phosphoesterase family protein [Diaminobutyricimonas aerilata]|uniref:Calcineurin-like phosphoesterase family protein n=1 Tax=Diaminobutyricimonas aerilata TaxID=1162967 RepID=A0A2M9CGF2_9MICO|nr:PKD domain-containing protein [Diaminobutyricimonas aerilata]PJJ70957.1 calcineurin-like phosphoesterase family protein [Diaminobutyricimonas aerilata]
MKVVGRSLTALAGLGLLATAIAVPAAVTPAAVEPAAIEPAATSLTFSASGDFSASTAAASVMTGIADSDSELHLALGDLSYGAVGAESAWCDFVTSRVGAGFPFELIAGNHESNGQNGNINDFSACLPNQLPGAIGTYGRQWYVDVPAADPLVRFVMISPALQFPDGTWSYAPGTPRYDWTASAIDGARAAAIPWVVVGMHMPCLSIGDYQCGPGAGLVNMLVSKRVDLVLSGHEHLYQRTHQLAHSAGCPAITPGTFTAACLADTDAQQAKGAGTTFATVGTGGTALRNANLSDSEMGYVAAYSALNANPTFGSLFVDVTDESLSARFGRASGGTFTDAVTIGPGAPPPPNAPPTASFTSSCAGLTCSFSGAASTDADGTIRGYAWEFGDGTTASGATVQHSYATAGDRTVRLTVTDDDGATASATRTVSVVAGAPPIAADAFGRTVATGLGSAEVGGPWSVTGTAANYAVDGTRGVFRLPTAGSSARAYLTQPSSTSTDLVATLSVDKPPTGGGVYATLIGRRIVGAGGYQAKVQLRATGTVGVSLEQLTATGGEVVLQSQTTAPGVTFTAGDRLLVRLRVTGTSPTTVQAKVWEAGTAEPTGWLRSVTNSVAALQAPGGVGLTYYLSSSTTNAPVVATVDDLLATTP